MSATRTLTLYHYWRSASSWRVRWALAHKGIPHTLVPVSLLDGEAESETHRRRHPMGYVPALEVADSGAAPRYLIQSLAIIAWLDETQSGPPLLPQDPWARAQARALSEIINADTHPIQNLSVQLLHSPDPEARKRWAAHWNREGLSAYEKIAANTAGQFSVGDELSIADLCLVPQCYNAERFGVDLSEFSTIARIRAQCLALASCRESEPDRFKPADLQG